MPPKDYLHLKTLKEVKTVYVVVSDVIVTETSGLGRDLNSSREVAYTTLAVRCIQSLTVFGKNEFERMCLLPVLLLKELGWPSGGCH